MKGDTESFCPPGISEWRQWLQDNHCLKTAVWLIQHKKSTGRPTISWSDAVDEALCFGWIDSVRRSVDKDTFMQAFSPRKPGSVWSKINKAKVERLAAEGRMTEAGYATIERAKSNGSWTILDEVEEVKIPRDLAGELRKQKGAKAHFDSFSRSARKAILQWLVLAKRPETRQKRLQEIAELAAQGLKPKQFR